MTHTRQALDGLKAIVRHLPREASKLPGKPESAKVVEALRASELAIAEPSEAALERVRSRLIEASNKGDFSKSRSDLRDAAWLLWADDRPLAGLPGLLQAVWLQAHKSNATARALIESWLRAFSQAGEAIAREGVSIRQYLILRSNPRMESWRHLDQKIELFSAQRGPRNLAVWVIAGPEPVCEILLETGFADPLRGAGGYIRAVQRELLSIAPAALTKPDANEALRRIFEFLAPDGVLRFDEPDARGEMARGLLQPWLRQGEEPEEATRRQIQNFLLDHLGDPRLRAQRWHEAGEAAANLMRRWLTRASLRAFFNLISEYALDSHWRYREAFWAACIEKSPQVEAWLALGSRIHASARGVEDLKGAYARLEGASGDKAALLLRVKNTVFCEWSHSGALRAWPTDWPSAPILGRSSYSRASLMSQSLPFPASRKYGSRGTADGGGLHHHGSDQSRWQGSAAELLQRRAQISLSSIDWTPR
ncbi:EH signature domain-containing protein [Bradyrhizobium sp. SZCCHNS3004]|uniref:EH signature domain-containing protein n=1 Tax=Bradyrhizobium sp. SZCCHNS3004 TaxID=3057312 RepID=UPI0029169DED|nr:EH signature domain-containing protein [Bradyrhizobium sp. SZCCHNS3004]